MQASKSMRPVADQFGSTVTSIGHELLRHDDAAQFWRSVDKVLRGAFRASNAAMFDWTESGPGDQLALDRCIFPREWPEYSKICYRDNLCVGDPVLKWLEAGAYRRHHGVTRVTKLIRTENYVGSALYQELLSPCDAHFMLTLAFEADGGLIGNVTLMRPYASGDFTFDDEQQARALVPILSLAFSRLVLKHRCRQRDAINRYLSESSSKAVVIADHQLRPVYATESGEALLAQIERFNKAPLHACLARSRSLSKLIENAEDAPPADSGVSVKISGTTRLSLKAKVLDAGASERLLALEFWGPQAEKAAWHSRYGLTQRESDVIAMIVEGSSNSEVAAKLSISPWTVKNHLQSVYAKVGVSNRTTLANLLLSGSS